MIKEIAFTVYAVTDIKKSRAFYEGIIGLTPSTEYDPNKPDAAWVEYNIGSGTFAIGMSPDWKPSQDGATIAFEVDNFDEFTAELKAKGAAFKLEPQSFPTCQMAVVEDPDKNKVIIHRRKQK